MRGRPVFASLVAVASASLLAAGVWTAHRWHSRRDASPELASSGAPALLQATPATRAEPTPRPLLAPLAGLDLSRITSDAAGPVAPTTEGTARLTLDEELQRVALDYLTPAGRTVAYISSAPEPESSTSTHGGLQ